MIPNLDFIRTLVNGLWFKIQRLGEYISKLDNRVTKVDAKIHDPDYAAEEGEAGYIKNKPVLVGRPGSAEGSEIFNDYESNYCGGTFAHAEGNATRASGSCAHAEGYNTYASGEHSHAEGNRSTANEANAHAEGVSSQAYGNASHSEGYIAKAYGLAAHAEGYNTYASGEYSHAEGIGTIAASNAQHTEGSYNIEDAANEYLHIVGNGTNHALRSNAHTLDRSGNAWFAGDVYVGSTSGINKDEGSKKLATEEYVNSVAMGNIEVPTYGVATPEADGLMSKEDKVKLDGLSESSGGSSGGSGVGAAGTGTNAEVFNGGAAENASGAYAHAEGRGTTASGEDSHAEGARTTASGAAAHAEGEATQATNFWSHAEGFECVSGGLASHAEGMGTIAASDAQHAEGSYNIEDAVNKYLHIVGNGASDTARSNAHTLDTNGNAWFAGKVFLGGYGQDDPDAIEIGAYEEWTFTLEDGSTVAKKVLVIG